MKNNNVGSQQQKKRVTNLQRRQQRENNRRKALARKMRKYPLCVSKEFIAYAYRKQWNAETVDAAALIMHRQFMMRRKLDWQRWIPIPCQVFKGLYGKKHYKRIKDTLIKDGFLEYNHWRNYCPNKCSDYGICRELRKNYVVSASYYLQTETLQEQHIKNIEYVKKMRSKAQRRERARKVLEDKFFIPTDSNDNDKWESYYSLVRKGYLTEVEFATIKRLAMNAHELEIKVREAELLAIIEKGYAKNRSKKETECTFDAYEHLIRNMYNRLITPRVSVKSNGRFYVPVTNMPSAFWDYTHWKRNQLSSVDVKSSHVYCLLALLKDIAINYFDGIGTHEERLARCQFSQQIRMIPGLLEHLRRMIVVYEVSKHFEWSEPIPDEPSARRKMMFRLFKKFTTRRAKTGKNYKTVKFDNNNPNSCNSEFTISTVSLVEKSITKSINPNTKSQSTCPSHPVCPITNTFQSQSVCSVYLGYESVGVGTQAEWYKQLVEDFSGCRVVLKSVHAMGQSATGVPVLQNLIFPSPEEIAEFERMLQDDFYLTLMGAIGIPSRERKTFKRAFLRFLYKRALTRYDRTDNNEEKIKEPVRLAMEARLPAIVHFLDICKCRPGSLDNRWEYYKWMARAIQRIESKIMLEVCSNLWKQYPGMFLVTHHDAIKCLPMDVPKVEAELKRTFAKYHIVPEFTRDDHKRPSDVNG